MRRDDRSRRERRVGAVLQTARRAGGDRHTGRTGPAPNRVAGRLVAVLRPRDRVRAPQRDRVGRATGAVFTHFAAGGGMATYGFATAPASSSAERSCSSSRTRRCSPRRPAPPKPGAKSARSTSAGEGRAAYLGIPKQNEFATGRRLPTGLRRWNCSGLVHRRVPHAQALSGRSTLRRGGPSGALGWPLGNETTVGRWQQRFQEAPSYCCERHVPRGVTAGGGARGCYAFDTMTSSPDAVLVIVPAGNEERKRGNDGA